MPDTQRIKDLFITLGVYRPVKFLNDRIRNPDRSRLLKRNMQVFSQFVRPGSLCFDIGANVGNKTEALLRLGARVVAVEPQPHCVRELNALFGEHPRFQCVPMAVGRAPGKARMHLSRTSGLSSLKEDWLDRWDSSTEVGMTTLDQLVETFGEPDFCKIDVEGFELEVLSGLSSPIAAFSFEYNVRYLDVMFGCLRSLERFGIQRVNISLTEEMKLLSDNWWDYETFKSEFDDVIARGVESLGGSVHWGGDIYVTCQHSAL